MRILPPHPITADGQKNWVYWNPTKCEIATGSPTKHISIGYQTELINPSHLWLRPSQGLFNNSPKQTNKQLFLSSIIGET